MPEPRKCYICDRPLSEDRARVHMAINADEMERQGVNDVSEIRDENAVLMMLCDVCGTREQAPTLEEIEASAKKLEEAEEAAKKPN